jgi:hypothetical protein
MGSRKTLGIIDDTDEHRGDDDTDAGRAHEHLGDRLAFEQVLNRRLLRRFALRLKTKPRSRGHCVCAMANFEIEKWPIAVVAN